MGALRRYHVYLNDSLFKIIEAYNDDQVIQEMTQYYFSTGAEKKWPRFSIEAAYEGEYSNKKFT